MQRWEYTFNYVDIWREDGKNKKGEIEHSRVPEPSVIWQTLKEKSGFDTISALGKEGWELIAVTPIHFIDATWRVLFTYKRPLED